MPLMLAKKIVLIDFSPIKTGGGVQLALNFLDAVGDLMAEQKVFFLLPEVGPLSDQSQRFPSNRTFLSPSAPLKRVIFENIELQKILRKEQISTVYTFFGPGLPHPSNVKSIVGVAYPIICYPESPFWKYIGPGLFVRQKLINFFRVRRLAAATKIIVETAVMKSRLMRALSAPEDKFVVIPPTVSEYVKPREFLEKFSARFLCLSGISPHKNLWRLYDIAKILKERQQKCTFVISATRENYLKHLLQTDVCYETINEYFEFIGSIPSSEIDRVYNSVDVMLTLSDLESFSNNYMEAWKAGIPIVASDRDFSHDICKDSAVYVDPHCVEDVAKAIIKVALDSELRRRMVKSGKIQLKLLPTICERISTIRALLNE